jgi:class 3 adenylate cyclase
VAEIKKFYEQSPTTMTQGGSQSATKGHFKTDQQLSSGTFKSEQVFNEQLGQKSSQFLDIMSKTIHKYGGDIVQFLGNSLIAVWPRKLFNKNIDKIENERVRKDRIEEDSNIIVCRKAVQCALEFKIESLKLFSGKN